MANKNERVINQLRGDLNRLIGRTFAEAAKEVIDVASKKMNKLQKDFVADVQSTVGADKPPAKIGVTWESLSTDWQDVKANAGLELPTFYHGLKKQYADFLSKNIEEVGGKPKIKIIQLGNKGEQVSITPDGKVSDPVSGQFAKRIEVPTGYQLQLRLFPKFNSFDDVVNHYGGGAGRRLTKKIAAGEFGASGQIKTKQATPTGGLKVVKWERPDRPFLVAFEVFYSITQMKKEFQDIRR